MPKPPVEVDPLVDSIRTLFKTYFVPSIRVGSESAASDASNLLKQGLPNPADQVTANTLLESARHSNEALDQLHEFLGKNLSRDSAQIMSQTPLDPKTIEGLDVLRGLAQKIPKVGEGILAEPGSPVTPRTDVESSNLSGVAYDAKQKKLQVQFNNGQIYEYDKVPEKTYVGLMAAHEDPQASVGEYFSKNIAKAFKYTKKFPIPVIAGAIGAGTVLAPQESEAAQFPSGTDAVMTNLNPNRDSAHMVQLNTPDGNVLIHPADIHVPPITDLTSRPEYINANTADQLKMKDQWWSQFGSRDPRITAIAQQQPEAIPRIRASLLGLPDPQSQPDVKVISSFVRGLASPLDALREPESLRREAETMGPPSTIPYIAGQMGAFAVGGTAARAALPILYGAGVAGQVTGDALMQGAFEAAQLKAQKMALLQKVATMDLAPERQQQVIGDINEKTPSYPEAFTHGAVTGALFDVALRSAIGTGSAAWSKYSFSRDLEHIASGELPKGTRAQDLETFMMTQDGTLDPATHIAQDGLSAQPEVSVIPGAPTRIFLKDGSQVSVKELALGHKEVTPDMPLKPQEYWDSMLQTRYGDKDVQEMLGTTPEDALDRGWIVRAGGLRGGKSGEGEGFSIRPMYRVTPKYVEQAQVPPEARIGWGDVAKIEGSQHYVNHLFEQMGQEMPVEQAPARALGADVFRVRDKYVVRLAGESPYILDNTDQLSELLHGLSTGGIVRIENKALQNLTEQGLNGFKLFKLISGGAGTRLEDLAQMGHEPAMPPDIPPPWRVSLGRYARPRKGTFLSAEQSTGVPVYSKVYEPIEESLLKRRVFTSPYQDELQTITKKLSSKQKEGYSLLFETTPDTPEFNKIITEFGLDRGQYDKMFGWSKRLFNDLGLNAENYFRDQLPKIRTTGGDPTTAFGNDFPPETQFFLDGMLKNRLGIINPHPSIDTLLSSHMNQGAWNKYVEPVYQQAKNWYNSLTTPFGPRAGKPITPGTAILAKNYLDDLVGHTTGTDRELMQTIGNTWMQIRNFALRRGEDVPTKQQAQEAGQHLFGWLLAHNYAANLSFRPAAVARQYLQTLQTTLPRLGHWATTAGILRAATKEGKDLVERSGLLVEDAPFISESGVKTIGGKLFRRADNIQRVIAGLGQDSLFQKYLPLYQQGGNWDRFIQKSAIEKFHPIVIGQVKQLIDQGDIIGARLRLMREVSEDTQWIYRRGNQPELFRGLGGRLFGQYGVWPSYYGEYLGQMLSRGSVQGRVGQTLRWIESQALLYGTLKTVLGANASSWLFFSPLQFQGGPFFQVANDALKAPGSGPEANLARSRLKKAPLQLVPGYQGMKDVYDALQTTNGRDLARELLGYPKAH